MSILAAIAAIRDLAYLIKDIVVKVVFFWQKKQQKDETKKLKEVLSEAQKATTINEKADAACKIEKLVNPDSSCDG